MENRREITVEALTAEAFAPFGDVIEATGAPWKMINAGRCGRYHDLARIDVVDGRSGISLFRSEAVSLPYELHLMERHPLGSQAFIPLSDAPFLVIVAPDERGAPGRPRAFRTNRRQGINYLRNVWHGVLTPLDAPADFIVVDRIGAADDPRANLEEHEFSVPYCVRSRAS